MMRRAGLAIAASIMVVACLAGCQAAGAFNRTEAQANVVAWTSQAVHAAGSPAPTAQTKLNAFQACRSDEGIVQTTSEWRTVTYIAIPDSRQGKATRAIEKSFAHADWRVGVGRGYVTIAGPDNQKLQGLITIQTAGSTQLAVTVVSPCYG